MRWGMLTTWVIRCQLGHHNELRHLCLLLLNFSEMIYMSDVPHIGYRLGFPNANTQHRLNDPSCTRGHVIANDCRSYAFNQCVIRAANTCATNTIVKETGARAMCNYSTFSIYRRGLQTFADSKSHTEVIYTNSFVAIICGWYQQGTTENWRSNTTIDNTTMRFHFRCRVRRTNLFVRAQTEVLFLQCDVWLHIFFDGYNWRIQLRSSWRVCIVIFVLLHSLNDIRVLFEYNIF